MNDIIHWFKKEVTELGWKWFSAVFLIALIFGVYNKDNIVSVFGVSIRRAVLAATEAMSPIATDTSKVLTGGKDENMKQDKYLAPQ